jgi:hypothetical protein
VAQGVLNDILSVVIEPGVYKVLGPWHEEPSFAVHQVDRFMKIILLQEFYLYHPITARCLLSPPTSGSYSLIVYEYHSYLLFAKIYGIKTGKTES